MCQSCLQKFSSPWGLLQHAQITHSLKIFFNQGVCPPTVEPTTPKSNLIGRDRSPTASSILNSAREDKSQQVPVVTLANTVNMSTTQQVVTPTATTLPGPALAVEKTSTLINTVALGVKAQEAVMLSTANTAKDSTGSLPGSTGTSALTPNNVKVVPVTDRVRPETTSVFTVLPHIPVLQPIKLPQGAVLGATLTPGALAPRIIAYNSIPRGPLVATIEKPIVLAPTTTTNTVLESSLGKTPLQPTPLPVKTSTEKSPTSREHVPQNEATNISRISEKITIIRKEKSISAPVMEKTVPTVPSATNLPQDTILTASQLAPQQVHCSAIEAKLPQAIVPAQPRTVPTDQRIPSSKPSKKKSCPCCEGDSGCNRNKETLVNVCPCGPINSPRKEKQPPSKSSSPPVIKKTKKENDPALGGNLDVTSDLPKLGDEIDVADKVNEVNDIVEQGGREEEEDEPEAESGIQCCNNQDCGVTIMPGTHESLKKCCNAVVPKKRKRHMETKHRIKKRNAEASYAPDENTIYIDFQTNSDMPCVSASNPGVTVSTDDTNGTITVNTSTSLMEPEAVSRAQSQRSLTLSIPVSYTRKPSCALAGRQRPVKLQPDQVKDHERGCGCDCCPLALQLLNSVRDIKTRRRSNSSESNKEAANVKGTEEEIRQIIANVKTENLIGEEEKSEEKPRSKSGIARIKSLKKSSILKSQSAINKKRRYPTSRPFKCDQCDHAFNQRIHLKKHQSKHTGKSYSPSVC